MKSLICVTYPYVPDVNRKGKLSKMQESFILLVIVFKQKYCKSGNFHAKIIHVLNIHFNLFSWIYGTHKNILT